MPILRIALAQLNVTVGDLDGNRRRIAEAILRAKSWHADVVVVPELAVTGYPPEDLLLKSSFIDANIQTLRLLAPATQGIIAVVGCVDRGRGGQLHNTAAIFANGRLIGTYAKQHLPNYGVFDERRYFAPGQHSVLLAWNGVRIGLTICEDLWEAAPCRRLARAGAQVVLNLSASPYHAGKLRARQRLFAQRAREHHVAVAYCNLVGGQDELVFDGASLILDPRGRLLARGAQFREDLVVADVTVPRASASRPSSTVRVIHAAGAPPPRPPVAPMHRRALSRLEEMYDALVLGTRDYIRKNGFGTVVLGLSGGIDSGLVACLAVDALGADRVVGAVMPSRFSSSATQADAKTLARALGMRCDEISIEPCFRAYVATLKPLFRGRAFDVAEQNIQARIRGNLLMALSNKFGWLVLTTGNKSEMATGYCTLYGDMAGGFAVIKDVPKMLVYQLARFRNRRGPGALSAPRSARQAGPIPARVFRRAPTAELAPHQTDQDTLPPYPELDAILKSYVEEDRSVHEMTARQHLNPSTVRRVVRMVDRTEYKRRQTPPGVKITPKAFGRDRRMPITNRYQDF